MTATSPQTKLVVVGTIPSGDTVCSFSSGVSASSVGMAGGSARPGMIKIEKLARYVSLGKII